MMTLQQQGRPTQKCTQAGEVCLHQNSGLTGILSSLWLRGISGSFQSGKNRTGASGGGQISRWRADREAVFAMPRSQMAL